MNDNIQVCRSCSKESTTAIPMDRVITKLDSFFAKNNLVGAEQLLCYWEKEARAINDKKGLLGILNEEIGLFRRLNKSEEGLHAANEALEIIETEGYGESISTATIYVNAATTMKAFGLAEQALHYYETAMKIYSFLGAGDFETAALFNNMASAYAQLNKSNKAEDNYLKAIALLKKSCKNDGEIAVSYVNLAHLYYDIDEYDERINSALETAWEYLNSKSTVKDGNYAFICSKCAPSFGFFGHFLRKKKLEEAAEKIYEGN